MTFASLHLMPQLLQAVTKSGYASPTPIQAATIPLVLAGKDVLGCAQTGTGKTAAFALPILQNLSRRPVRPGAPRPIRALILTPTRELAQQIQDNFVAYGKQLALFSCVLFGGVNQNAQVEALHRGADIVVACPGRLMDLMNQGYVRLDYVEAFVLDEADRMLDMGFIHDVRRIAAKLPPRHQTLLFSATMPPEVETLAMQLLHAPETVKVDPVSSPVEAIEQTLYYVDKANKKHLLAQLLREPEVENALVFSRTRHGADRIVRDLDRAGIPAAAIHGDKSQNARQAALDSFKRGESKVLVATDIAARGIDIAGLSHVINYDLPNEPEAYVHRIGRTGRAGADGFAVSLVTPDTRNLLRNIQKFTGQEIPEMNFEVSADAFEPVEGADERLLADDESYFFEEKKGRSKKGGKSRGEGKFDRGKGKGGKKGARKRDLERSAEHKRNEEYQRLHQVVEIRRDTEGEHDLVSRLVHEASQDNHCGAFHELHASEQAESDNYGG